MWLAHVKTYTFSLAIKLATQSGSAGDKQEGCWEMEILTR